jgi:hypothetical protein
MKKNVSNEKQRSKIKVKWLTDWDDSDTHWCPTQLYRDFKYNDQKLTLYCRWRHDDPWSFSILPNKYSNFPWTGLGVGMSEKDNFDDIHIYAEKLLKQWMTVQRS